MAVQHVDLDPVLVEFTCQRGCQITWTETVDNDERADTEWQGEQ
jgi:hypothetical protein